MGIESVFRAPLFRAVAVVVVLGFQPPAKAAPSAAELEQAGNLFAISCSSSFCHGAAGVGARGPTLRDRDFTPDFVRTTMLNGRSGTAMPAFKSSLNAEEVNMIVAYVMSLSPNDPNAGGGAAAPPVPDMTEIGPLDAEAQAGSDIFFDIAKPTSCSLCHSYAQRGGPIGPDLTSIAKKSPRDIYDSMMKPPSAEPGYPVVTVTTQNGQHITGIRQFEDGAVVRLYDLSSTPPVLRSFYVADGNRIDPAAQTAAPYRHTLQGLSDDQIARLVTFLKSADPAAKDVTPRDFAVSQEAK